MKWKKGDQRVASQQPYNTRGGQREAPISSHAIPEVTSERRQSAAMQRILPALQLTEEEEEAKKKFVVG